MNRVVSANTHRQTTTLETGRFQESLSVTYLYISISCFLGLLSPFQSQPCSCLSLKEKKIIYILELS